VSARISISNGSIYLAATDYGKYFQGIETVIVLIDGGYLQILPVKQMASGGYLLKIRNAQGDRVITSPDVFQNDGRLDWSSGDIIGKWSSDRGALVCELPELQT